MTTTSTGEGYRFVAVYAEPSDTDRAGHWTHHRTREAAMKAKSPAGRHGRVVEIAPEPRMTLAAQERVIEQIKASR